MIEFALLFGLGFLSAALLTALLAPAVHRRIVVYTEQRMRATMPLSPQEVRAQKDMVRAAYAAENARTSQALAEQRESNVGLRISSDNLVRDMERLTLENTALTARLTELGVNTESLRQQLGKDETRLAQIATRLDAAEAEKAAWNAEREDLNRHIARLGATADGLKIDLATRDAQIESLKSRILGFRDEREDLREDVKRLTDRAKDAEFRLAQEENRLLRLEERLNREQTASADKENLIARRTQEIARLREKLESMKNTGPRKTLILDDHRSVEPSDTASEVPTDIAGLTEDIRDRGRTLSERLMRSRNGDQDEAMREEMGAVAARMVALTALREGPSSPVHTIIDTRGADDGTSGRSLADLISDAMGPQPRQT